MNETNTETLNWMIETLKEREIDHTPTNGKIEIIGEEGATLATVSINGLGFDVDFIFSASPGTCDTPDEVLDIVREMWT